MPRHPIFDLTESTGYSHPLSASELSDILRVLSDVISILESEKAFDVLERKVQVLIKADLQEYFYSCDFSDHPSLGLDAYNQEIRGIEEEAQIHRNDIRLQAEEDPDNAFRLYDEYPSYFSDDDESKNSIDAFSSQDSNDDQGYKFWLKVKIANMNLSEMLEHHPCEGIDERLAEIMQEESSLRLDIVELLKTKLKLSIETETLNAIIKITLAKSKYCYDHLNTGGFITIAFHAVYKSVQQPYLLHQFLTKVNAEAALFSEQHSAYLKQITKRSPVPPRQLNHCDINRTGGYGETILHWAAYNGNVEWVEYLYENGFDINAQDDKKSRTPLMWAALRLMHDEQRYLKVLKFLLDKEANPGIRDHQGRNFRDVLTVVGNVLNHPMLKNTFEDIGNISMYRPYASAVKPENVKTNTELDGDDSSDEEVVEENNKNTNVRLGLNTFMRSDGYGELKQKLGSDYAVGADLLYITHYKGQQFCYSSTVNSLYYNDQGKYFLGESKFRNSNTEIHYWIFLAYIKAVADVFYKGNVEHEHVVTLKKSCQSIIDDVTGSLRSFLRKYPLVATNLYFYNGLLELRGTTELDSWVSQHIRRNPPCLEARFVY